LRAATRDAALFLRRDREIGTIAVGRRADLVLRGHAFDRTALTRLLDDVSRAAELATNDWPKAPDR